VAACTQEVHCFASDKPGAPENDYFHMFVFGFRCYQAESGSGVALFADPNRLGADRNSLNLDRQVKSPFCEEE
jgi:hypothetical protein